PMLIGQTSIFGYLQKMNAIYFVPIFAVVLVGMLTKRVPAIAANIGMAFAFALIIAVYFVPGCGVIIDVKSDYFILHNFHFIGMVLLISVAIMLLIGKLKPMADPFVHQHSGDVDMTPWKFAKPVGAVLISIVLAVYTNFADMSVIGEVEGIERICAALFILAAAFTIYKFAADTGNIEDDKNEEIDLDTENTHS
ncbi:MAG: hypothetical protein HRT88_08135, partial [Lentisphaeraceae bacterium]|nr:hypothetical protein [Lentisphaeraceae bacterium]